MNINYRTTHFLGKLAEDLYNERDDQLNTLLLQPGKFGVVQLPPFRTGRPVDEERANHRTRKPSVSRHDWQAPQQIQHSIPLLTRRTRSWKQ